MQTPGLPEMLQLLQTPAGATLLPMANERNNLMMDQGRASLADTLARTQIARNEDARAGEKHPLTLEQLRLGNTSTNLANQKARFGLDVDNQLGPEFYANEKRGASADKDFNTFKSSLSILRDSAAVISQAPVGSRKALAKDFFTKGRIPQMIPIIEGLSEEDIPKFMEGITKKLIESTPKYAVEDLKQTAQTARTTETNETRERIAARRDATLQTIAQLKAFAKQATARAKASGDQDAMKNSNIIAIYTHRATLAMEEGDEDKAQFWTDRAQDAAKNIRFKKEAPQQDVEETIYDSKGNPIVTTRKRKVPAGTSTKPDDDISGFKVTPRNK